MAIVTEVHSSGTSTTGTLSGNVLINDATGQVIVRDGTQSKILIGAHPVDGRAGIWVSKENVDVVEELRSGS